MDKKGPNYLKSGNSGKRINKDFMNINYKLNFKRSKIRPRNIFNNNKLFAYQKAAGNIILLKKLIHQTFIDKYYHDKNFYNSKVIDDIINNESTHVVAEFKEYLIYGDDSEFLQKNYNIEDCKKYLPKIFNYYESCSVIFPNYVILPESKYIYKNIQRKQRVIDLQQEQEDKLEKKKGGQINDKKEGNGKKESFNLFNTKAINSILGETNTSNINKIFGINNNKNNETNNENSLSLFNNIIKEIDKKQEKKHFCKKNINLIKNKYTIPTLNLNNSKGLIKQNNIQIKENENNNIEKSKSNYKKKTYIIVNKNNNNIKHLHIKRKSYNKKNEDNKSSLNLNNSKKNKNQKSLNEKKQFLTNENNTNNIYCKIPKSKLSIDLDGIKKHMKLKSNLNEKEIYNQKGISFFNDILKKKKLKRHNSKINISMGKSSSKTKKQVNSFIPSQKKLSKLMTKDKFIYISKSIKKNKDKLNQINYSSSPSLLKNKTNKKLNNSQPKIPKIFIKDSNSSTNILKSNTNFNNNNNLSSNRSKSIIRRRITKKGNTFIQDNNYNENLTTNKEVTSESNINININTLSITDREKTGKKIYFTIAPHINNMINLNKIKYMMRTNSRENIANYYNNEIKTFNSNNNFSKNIKNKKNIKNNMVNKKNIYYNKNMKINKSNNKKKSKSFKSSYKNSNTQISSSIGTAACSYGKNSHLMDFETIKVYQKRTCPNPILVKPKSINNKKNYNDNAQRKFSLSPDKVESKQIVKKMLLNDPYGHDKCCKSLNNNAISKKVPFEQNKKQKNIVLPIRKEKESSDIKVKELVNLVLNSKEIPNNYGNISRNMKMKHQNNDKSIITITNRTNKSINNTSSKKPMLSGLISKNSNSSIKNKHIYPYNKTYYGNIKNNK